MIEKLEKIDDIYTFLRAACKLVVYTSDGNVPEVAGGSVISIACRTRNYRNICKQLGFV